LVVDPATPASAAPRSQPEGRVDARVLDVRANFCNLRDGRGRVIFTPFIASLPPNERLEWYEAQRRAGSTHLVVAPHYDYPNSPVAGRDMRKAPAEFRALLDEILRTPSASGQGFVPIVMWANTPDEVDAFWPSLMAASRDLAPRIVHVPAWEPTWTAGELAHGIARLRALMGPDAAIFFHGGPREAAGAMADGGAPDFWTTGVGRELSGFLYQTEHGKTVVEPCTRRQDGTFAADCWLNRWQDIVARLGAGRLSNDRGEDRGAGWRKVRLVLFETVAYDYYRGGADERTAQRVADDGDAICRQWGVTCGFGNGLPSRASPR